MIHISIDSHEAGTKEISLPECQYSYILFNNNTQHNIRVYSCISRSPESLVADCSPYMITTFPKPTTINQVYIDFTGARPGERAHIYFMTENPGLVASLAQSTAPSLVNVVHLSLPLANTWYSHFLSNIRLLQISLRAPTATQWEVELPGTGLPLMMSQTQMYYMRDVLFTGTIRIRANAATEVAQIETWR